LSHLDRDTVPDVCFGDNHDIAALNFRDSVALVSEILDLYFSLLTFLNRRGLKLLLLVFVVSRRFKIQSSLCPQHPVLMSR
jgi:hypothetical protein